MKLNVRHFQHLAPEDWRVLQAFEQGSRNHEVVPTKIATSVAGLHKGSGGVTRSISTLAKAGLIAKVKNASYDGYRLTYGGFDYLALHAHVKSNAVIRMGSTMGVGKESDIVLVQSPHPITGAPAQSILKIHRLGRISFRSASTKRSYHGNREHASWQLLSRLSAQKEYKAMNLLRDAGFRTPRPIAWNRHMVVMSLVPGMPLRQVPLTAFAKKKANREERVALLYADLIELVMRLAEFGVIHGDMNEFNVLIEGVPEDLDEQDEEIVEVPTASTRDDYKLSHTVDPDDSESMLPLIPHVIDFPQITSLSHPQAEEFFDRDIRGIKEFFRKRYHFQSESEGPTFSDALARQKKAAERGERKLDIEIEAAGYNKKASKELDKYYDIRKQTSGEETNEHDEKDLDAIPDEDARLPQEDDDFDQNDGEVDLFAAARAQTIESIGVEQAVPLPASNAYQDLVLGLEEMRLSPQGSQISPPTKTKASAGWSI